MEVSALKGLCSKSSRLTDNLPDNSPVSRGNNAYSASVEDDLSHAQTRTEKRETERQRVGEGSS